MRVRALIASAAAGAVLACPTPPATASATPPRGAVTVLAHVPSPGYPADPRVVGNVVYEGTYDNPYGDTVPSKVFEFSDTGSLLGTFTVAGQNLSQPHGVQVGAVDVLGRLILLDKTSGRILQLDPRTGVQDTYATVPDIPTCSADANRMPCSPAVNDQAPMPDYSVWGPDGSLYVTDYQQAVIWRIPPGGGTAQEWLADRRLDGMTFGTAGIALEPDHRTLLFDQASNAGLGSGNPATGKLYSVAIESNGRPGPLTGLWESPAAALPDGFAVGQSGHIYLAEVGLTNQIVELSTSGQQLSTFGQIYSGDNGSAIPFDSPSGVSFLGTELVIANQSYLADNPSNQALLELQTGEVGQPVFIPANAGLRPGERLSGTHHRKHKHKHRRHKHRRHKHRHRKARPHPNP